MQKQLEVQAPFPTVQGLLGAWRADLSNLPQRDWFLVQVSSLPVKALATSHWCRMELQDRAAQNTEKRKLGPWWETARGCEIWTINLEIQDNDRIVASLWLSQYSNLLVCLSGSLLSICLSVSLALSLSLIHTVYEKSAEMEYGPPEMEYGYLEVFPQNEKSLNLWCSGSQDHLSPSREDYVQPVKGICHLMLQQTMAVWQLASRDSSSIPPGVTPYRFSARHRVSILSDFGSAKPVSCWEFLPDQAHLFLPFWSSGSSLALPRAARCTRDCTESAVL